MKTLIDGRFIAEAERWDFRFTCEDCAHFGTENGTCSLGYRAAPRRAELDLAPVASARVVELCKTFELA
jgi:hypothetical protein